MKQIITQHGWGLNKYFWDDYKVDFLKNNWQNSLINLNREKINNLAIHGLNTKQHLDWVLVGEGKKFISWILEK